MNYRNRNEEDRLDDNRSDYRQPRHENYPQPQSFRSQPFRNSHQDNWLSDADTQDWGRHRSGHYNQPHDRYTPDRSRNEMDNRSYDSRHQWPQQQQRGQASGHQAWPHGSQHSEQPRNYRDNRFESFENENRRPNRFESAHDWDRSRQPYTRPEPEHQPYNRQPENRHSERERRHHSSGVLGVGAVGGSFTSYSASRSRSGAMGHGSSGGILHRDGPGMNSYARGDINANSNW